eukprot:2264673-Pyramimonas_sp.AAC.1
MSLLEDLLIELALPHLPHCPRRCRLNVAKQFAERCKPRRDIGMNAAPVRSKSRGPRTQAQDGLP